MNDLSETLERKWETTCGLIFGKPVGQLKDYSGWLSEMPDPVFTCPSSASGKEVTYSVDYYSHGSRRIGFDEVDFFAKSEPISANDITDIDSLMRAISERACFAGNVILGNSKYIERSANVSDSFYVYGSNNVGDSKYVAYSSMARLCESVFGSLCPGESEYLIRCHDTYHTKRSFELWMSAHSSDCYYVFDVGNCSDCMFSFGLRSAKYAIGNVRLSREKYMGLKSALLEQMRSELEQKKRLPSIIDFLKKAEDCSEEAKKALAAKFSPKTPEKASMAPIDGAFSRTSKILLDKELVGIATYEGWLNRHVQQGARRKSALTGSAIFVGGYGHYLEVPENRIALADEAHLLSEIMPPQEGIERITFSSAHKFVGKAAFFALNYHDGTNKNVIDCATAGDSANCYRSSPIVLSKYCACSHWPRNSEHCFGCGIVFDSSFCFKCFQSVKLTRCMEMDSCRDCSDCYFCHNVENCTDCMFCFNAKNLRYAIGNSVVGKEEYARIKKIVLTELGAKLEKDKKLDLSIYDIGAKK